MQPHDPIQDLRPLAHLHLVYNDAGMLLSGFSHWLVSWGASASTVEKRISVLLAALAILGDPLEVRSDQIVTWLARPEWSQWTRVTYFAHLRSFFGWLYETGQRPDDPMHRMRAPKSPKCKPRPLTADETMRALEATRGDIQVWLQFGLLAGLRVHEIAKLRGEHISSESLYVIGKGGKEALLPVHPDLWRLAEHYPRSGWWFPRPTSSGHIASNSITNTITRVFKNLGIEGSHHRCRHTFGTNLLRNGVNIRIVQELLRHESLATTQMYTEVTMTEQEAAIATLGGWPDAA